MSQTLKRKGQTEEVNRRQFLATSTIGSVALLSFLPSSGGVLQSNRPSLMEYGFWDYTTPGAGGMERYQREDYFRLLDDMALAGMNSLCIYVKWLSTGYRSRLSFQDQLADNPVIASDNSLLRQVIEEAQKRKIKIWLGGAVTYFDAEKFGSKPYHITETIGGYRLPIRVGVYDTDTPGLAERIVQIYEELVELFAGLGGLVVELEGSGVEQPHRVPLYNKWARENGHPPFEKLGHPFNPRDLDVASWRDYTTYSRFKVLHAVQQAVRNKGFRGDLAMICETGKTSYSIFQEVNLHEYRNEFPAWKAITYEYDKWEHRFAMMDVCIETPKKEGLQVFYLPRGVMTWGRNWPLPISLEQSWELDLDDIRRFQPHGLWWFGSGTLGEGAHVSLSRLRKVGYRDGVDARKALLGKTSELRAV